VLEQLSDRGDGGLIAREQVVGHPRVDAVYPALAYVKEVDKGGHFAAREEPQLFSEEVRAAFASLR
jgi:pimeloyl-ACP methyl ester carboxylesterase